MMSKQRRSSFAFAATACGLLTFLLGMGFGLAGRKEPVVPAAPTKKTGEKHVSAKSPPAPSTPAGSTFEWTSEYDAFFWSQSKKHPRLTAADIHDRWMKKQARKKSVRASR